MNRERGARGVSTRIRERLSYANAMATIAVFISLGGGAYALSRGEVKSKHIAKNAVKSKHVKNNNLKGKDIKDNSLTGSDVNESTLALPTNATPTGPAGGDLTETYPNPLIGDGKVTTAKVLDGSLTGIDIDESTLDLDLRRETSSTVFDSSSPKELTESCPPGTQLVSAFYNSGGARSGTFPNEVINIAWEGMVMPGGPNDPPAEVFVRAVELPGGFSGNWAIALQLICADIAG